jgi:GDPmannose 4,6-dehydratase
MTALIFGAGGQTGSYLAEHLIRQGNSVIGVTRRASRFGLEKNPLYKEIIYDITSPTRLFNILQASHPSVIYNLASLSSVKACEDNPEFSKQINFEFVNSLLRDALKYQNINNFPIKIIQASSSEMYTGDLSRTSVDEKSPLNPGSVYGEHKALAHDAVTEYRKRKNLWASNVILFNHESPRRPENFVSRKITKFAYYKSLGKVDTISLGNLNVERDWGYAPDYALGMAKIANLVSSGNYLLASGELHSILKFGDAAFRFFKLGSFIDSVNIDDDLKRSNEHPGISGNNLYTLSKIGGLNAKNFSEIVSIMCSAEIELDKTK